MRSRFLTPSRVRFRLRPDRLLWLVYGLFFIAGVGQAAIVPLLPRVASAYGLSASQTALLLAVPGLATLAVSVPAGVVADRVGARRVTLAAGGLLCLSCLAQAAPSLALLLAGRVAFGVVFGVVWTSGMAWLSEVHADGEGGRVGASVTSSSVGVMVGPVASGILAQHTTIGFPFLVIAAGAAFLVAPLALGSAAPRSARAGTPAPTTSPRALGSLLRRPEVRAAGGGLLVSGAVAGASQLLITLGLHRYGLSTSAIGVAFSAGAVCYIVISAVIVRLGRRAFTLRVNALSTLLLSLALVPALLGGGPPALVVALLLTAAPRAAIGTIAYPLAGERSQDARGNGFVFGMLNGAWAGAMVLTPVLAGALDQHGGARAGYLAVIVPSCAIAAWLVARSRAWRVTPALPAAEASLRSKAASRVSAKRTRDRRRSPDGRTPTRGTRADRLVHLAVSSLRPRSIRRGHET